MYADRYHRPGLQPGSLAVSLAITGALIAGAIFSSPNLVAAGKDPPLKLITVALDPPPPPPEPPEPMPKAELPRAVITAPEPKVMIPTDPVVRAADPIPTITFPTGISPDPIPTATATPAEAPPPPLPALIGSSVDPRYADALQPPYPAEERRAEREGRVVVKVLVGVDGRVKQVEQVSSASEAFFAATERQALSRWRFRPATRGGVPVESWRTMAVNFVLQDG
jgi:protein TonB